MSSNTRLAEAAAATRTLDRAAFWLRLCLVAVYLVVAHFASTGESPALAAWALLDVAVIVLLPALLRARPAAWIGLCGCAIALWWLSSTPHVWLPLLLVPVACVGLVAFGFARTLRQGRVPLVMRIVAALDGTTPQDLAPELQAYARRLTLAWALLLSALALFDLAMALFASREQWSWLANIGDYVVIGGFMLLEFAWRRHRFPGRHRGFIDFIRRMVGLGPAFWRGVASP